MTTNNLPIDKNISTSVIEALLSKVKSYYVFPEIAKKIEESVWRRLGEGAYDDITTGAALSEAVTNDMHEISQDKHLKLLYSEEAQDFQEDVNLDFDPAWLEDYRQMCMLYGFGIAKVERLTGNVGYLDLRTFHDAWLAGEAASWAMNLLAHTSALIIDLRLCSGGDPAMVTLLCSYFFGIEPVHLNDLYSRPNESIQQYWTVPYTHGKRYIDKPIYVLTSHKTFSASEEFAYDLQNLKRATIIGETTGGGANLRDTYQIHPHFQLQVPTARAINPITGTNWEGTGVKPDIEVSEEVAFKLAYKEALQKVLTGLRDNPVGPYKAVMEEAQKALGELEG